MSIEMEARKKEIREKRERKEEKEMRREMVVR